MSHPTLVRDQVVVGVASLEWKPLDGDGVYVPRLLMTTALEVGEEGLALCLDGEVLRDGLTFVGSDRVDRAPDVVIYESARFLRAPGYGSRS